MRKLVIFLYFVFLFKLAFAQSLPSIPGFGSFKDIEPAAGGTQTAQAAQVPSLEDPNDNSLPADFDLPVSENAKKKDDTKAADNATAPATTGKVDIEAPSLDLPEMPGTNNTQADAQKAPAAPEFDAPAAPAATETGSAIVAPAAPEVTELPKLPDQNTSPVATATTVATPAKTATPNAAADTSAKTGTSNIDKEMGDNSVRDQFPTTPDLEYKNTKEEKEKAAANNTPEPSPEEREKEVDNLLDQVFDKEKTPEEIAKDKAEKENDEKMTEQEKNAKQNDDLKIENVVDVADKPVAPIDELKTDDEEQQDLADLPASMKSENKGKNRNFNVSGNGADGTNESGEALAEMPARGGAYSNTYSERQLSQLLVKSSMNGDKENVIELIRSGRNINAQNEYGESALMGAVYNNHNDIAEILLSEGANPNLLDNKGNSSLIVAAAKNNVQAVQQLIRAGANVDQANRSSDTPLLVAALNGNSNVIDILVRQGADINKPNADGLTALHIAAYNGNAQLAKYLLSVGANPNLVARGGFKPYDLAKTKNPEVAQLLESYSTKNQNTVNATKIASEIKQRTAAPVVPANANASDPYAVYPKAFVEDNNQTEELPQSNWWAAKAPAPASESNYASANTTQPVNRSGMNTPASLGGNKAAPVTPVTINNVPATVQAPAVTNAATNVPTQPVQSLQVASEQTNIPVQNMSVAPQTATQPAGLQKVDYSNIDATAPKPASIAFDASKSEQSKKWTKLTVDQQSMKMEEQRAEAAKQLEIAKSQAPQQIQQPMTNAQPQYQASVSSMPAPAQKASYEFEDMPADITSAPVPANNMSANISAPAAYTSATQQQNAPLVRARYDNNGHIITTNVAAAPMSTPAPVIPVAVNNVAAPVMLPGFTPVAAANNNNVAPVNQSMPAVMPASFSIAHKNVQPQAMPVQPQTQQDQAAILNGFTPVQKAAPMANIAPQAAPAPQLVKAVYQQPQIAPAQPQQAYYNQPISNNINISIPRYADLDASKQAVWDKKLEEWVRNGININAKDDSQKIFWVKQQAVLEQVYQGQFSNKVEMIKRKIGSSAMNVVPAIKKNNILATGTNPADIEPAAGGGIKILNMSNEMKKQPKQNTEAFTPVFKTSALDEGEIVILNHPSVSN